MTSDEYEDILYDYRILRWSARILGTLEIMFFLGLAYDQIIKGLIEKGLSAWSPLFGGQYFFAISMTIIFIGLVIAYWKEGLGGGITWATYIVFFIGWQDLHVGFIIGMGIASSPAVLYVIYWLCVHRAIKKLSGIKQATP